MSAPTNVPHCRRHPETETRLTCAYCDTPICPKCMVMTDVGIKCPSCVEGTKSHVLQVENRHLITASLLAGAAGVLFGFAAPWLGRFWLIGFILAFVLGRLAGEGIGRATRYKMGLQMTVSVTMGALVGLLSGPFGEFLWTYLVNPLLKGQTSGLEGMGGYYLFSHLVYVVLFITGLRQRFRYK